MPAGHLFQYIVSTQTCFMIVDNQFSIIIYQKGIKYLISFSNQQARC